MRDLVRALSLCAVFLVVQLLTVDYGTRLNDLDHIRAHRVEGIDLANSALGRDAIVAGAGSTESLDRWMMRFKLYSVEADEAVIVMALARIQPGSGRFDPHLYLYGGGFLYPLGAWFYALSTVGLMPVGGLEGVLGDPDRMDRVYVWGRVFVLSAFVLSALVLWATLRLVSAPGVALAGTGIYLFCPASIMFSAALKPHWYALLYAAGALFILVRSFARRALKASEEFTLAVCLGLAVGSVVTFGLFSIVAWCALLAAARRDFVDRAALLRTPAVALAVYLVTNPFVIINWRALAAEGESVMGWYAPSGNPAVLWSFTKNSLLPGAGVVFGTLLLILVVRELVRPSFAGGRGLAAAIGLAMLGAATTTATLAHWHTNLRYVPYALAAGVLLVAAAWPARSTSLALVFALTAAQSVPMKLAYFDENSARHSTRLRAAAWIDANVPSGSGICLGTVTPAPYDVPPFDLARYVINEPGCPYRVAIEREADGAQTPAGFAAWQRFRPRLSPAWFPLVFNHINPQITIYRRT